MFIRLLIIELPLLLHLWFAAAGAVLSISNAHAGNHGSDADATLSQTADVKLAARSMTLAHRAALVSERYVRAQHDCYSRFFVNRCLGRAHAQMHADKAALRAERLALDHDKRATRARQRLRRQEEQRAREKAAAAQHTAKVLRNQARYEGKQRQHQLDQARAQAALSRRKRAENAARYNAKQLAAEQHRNKVQARRKRQARGAGSASPFAADWLAVL